MHKKSLPFDSIKSTHSNIMQTSARGQFFLFLQICKLSTPHNSNLTFIKFHVAKTSVPTTLHFEYLFVHAYACLRDFN